MIRLAIDTSSPIASVAIETNSGEIFVSEALSKDTHSQNLAALVDEARRLAALSSFEFVDEIVVGLGPGSFTGLRIGLSYAKGVSWAYRIPLRGRVSFPAIAERFWREAECVAVVSDARRDEFFFAAYCRDQGVVEESIPLQICGKDLIERYLLGIPEGKRVVIVDAGCAKTHPFSKPMITAAAIARGLLAQAATGAGWGLGELSSLEPHYLRTVSALTIAEREAAARGSNQG